MITITLTGDCVENILNQMRDFAAQMQAVNGAQESQPESAEPEPAPEPKPKRGRPPRPPVAETEAIEMPPVDATENDPEPEVEQPPLNDAIADEKVKAEVIRTLQSIYNSGKVQVIRHVLSKYGEGAKSFPEIEASRFPAIREALARGEIA